MARVRAVIIAVDELLSPDGPVAHSDRLAAAVGALAGWCRVWVVGATPLPLPPEVAPRIQRAANLQDVASLPDLASGERADVLVVGAHPRASVRFGNARSWSTALVAADGPPPQSDGLDEAPDFILPDVEDLPHLVARIERDEADFEGVE